MKLHDMVQQLAAIHVVRDPDLTARMDIDRQVARETACPACGQHGLLFEAFSRDGRYHTALAYCPEDYEALSF